LSRADTFKISISPISEANLWQIRTQNEGELVESMTVNGTELERTQDFSVMKFSPASVIADDSITFHINSKRTRQWFAAPPHEKV